MSSYIIIPALWMGYNDPESGIKLSNFQYSQLAELAVANRFVEMVSSFGITATLTEHTEGCDARYDFRVNDKKIELKISGQLIKGKQTISVETHSNTPNGVVPSGLSTTEADAYLFINAGTWSSDVVVKWRFLPVSILKQHVDFDAKTGLSGIDKNGYQSLGCKLKVDQKAPISLETPYGDGMFAFGPCVVDSDKPFAFDAEQSNVFRKNRTLTNAIGEFLK